MIYVFEDTYDKNKDASVDERFLIWAVALFDYYMEREMTSSESNENIY